MSIGFCQLEYSAPGCSCHICVIASLLSDQLPAISTSLPRHAPNWPSTTPGPEAPDIQSPAASETPGPVPAAGPAWAAGGAGAAVVPSASTSSSAASSDVPAS